MKYVASRPKFCIVGNEKDEGQYCTAAEGGTADISENQEGWQLYNNALLQSATFPCDLRFQETFPLKCTQAPFRVIPEPERAGIIIDRGERRQDRCRGKTQ